MDWRTTSTAISFNKNKQSETLFCAQSTRDSLPKLRLNKFDGDPLHWSDWSSMFELIVHDANLSLNGKMQHLQNSVIGRAKSELKDMVTVEILTTRH